jgi:hypothetical protein
VRAAITHVRRPVLTVESIELVALGLDLRHWKRFLLWTPWVYTRDGKWFYRWRGSAEKYRNDPNHVDFCRRFVIGAAIRMQSILREP